MSEWDVEAVREEFPALGMEVNGYPLCYLDNAASAQKPRAVTSAMDDLMGRSYGNVHRALHTLGSAATEAYEGARDIAARFLGAEEREEVVFTSGGTDAFNLVAWGYGSLLEEGDEVLLSVMEHHSNIVPWMMLSERSGVVLRWAELEEDGSLDMGSVERAFEGGKVKLAALTQSSNVLGTRPPIKELARMAHEYGARLLVDGCQGAVHGAVDVGELECDFYVMTGHKLYGPTGVGVLYGKREALEEMKPFRGGGEMIREVKRDGYTTLGPPHKFEAGTPPFVEAVGLGAAMEFMEGLDMGALTAHEASLERAASRGLRDLGMRVWGEAEGKAPISSFSCEGAHADDLATLLDGQGVAVRSGRHCAEVLHDTLGLTGTARASFGMYNTVGEVERLLEGVEEALGVLGVKRGER